MNSFNNMSCEDFGSEKVYKGVLVISKTPTGFREWDAC